MYALNLVFDLSKGDGLFGGNDDTPGTGIPEELRLSLKWLKWKGLEPQDSNSPPFDPELDNWKKVPHSGTILLSKQKNPGSICIRAMQHQGPQPFTADKLQLVISFGRPARFYQPQASPFTSDGLPTGSIVTTFIEGPRIKNTTRGWWYSLGQIAIAPTEDGLTHRYEFSVGLIVTAGNRIFHYGEDPEMDIEM